MDEPHESYTPFEPAKTSATGDASLSPQTESIDPSNKFESTATHTLNRETTTARFNHGGNKLTLEKVWQIHL